MTIDNIDISLYNATLFGYDVETTEIKNNYFVFKDSPYFTFYNSDKALKKISIRMLVEGVAEETTDINISNIIKLCKEQSVIKFNATDLLSYDCVYNSNSIKKITPFCKELTIEVDGFAHKDIVSKTLTGLDKVVNNTGTCKVPCIIEVANNTASAINNVVVAGITITSIAANKTIIIDGIEKIVTVDDVNKLLDTDLTQFPMLEIGSNTIDFTAGTVTVKYYPTFI
jgi:hypothetical protein